MGMAWQDVRHMPISLLFRSISQWHEDERGRQEREVQLAYEVSRWQATVLLSPHVKKGKQLKASDLAVFPWEEEVPSVSLGTGAKRETTAEMVARLKKEGLIKT